MNDRQTMARRMYLLLMNRKFSCLIVHLANEFAFLHQVALCCHPFAEVPTLALMMPNCKPIKEFIKTVRLMSVFE
jgi:hypothetical protein